MIPLKRDQLKIVPGWETRGPAGLDGWYPVLGDNAADGFDLIQSSKGEGLRMISIVAFSKGGD